MTTESRWRRNGKLIEVVGDGETHEAQHFAEVSPYVLGAANEADSMIGAANVGVELEGERDALAAENAALRGVLEQLDECVCGAGQESGGLTHSAYCPFDLVHGALAVPPSALVVRYEAAMKVAEALDKYERERSNRDWRDAGAALTEAYEAWRALKEGDGASENSSR